MYRDVLSSIEGIEIYPIISLLIFFAFFVGAVMKASGGRANPQRVRELLEEAMKAEGA